MQAEEIELDSYWRHFYLVLSKRDVENLVAIWRETAYLGEEGKEIRQLIKEVIPSLAGYHGVSYEGDSFRDFVTAYDKHLLDQECGTNTEECLLYFAAKGHLKGVLRAIERGAKNWLAAIRIAAQNGQLKVITDLLWDKFLGSDQADRRSTDEGVSPVILKTFFIAAARSGDIPTMQFFLNLWPGSVSFGIVAEAAKYGHLSLVKYLLEDDDAFRASILSNSNLIYWAILSQNKDLVEYLLSQGKVDIFAGVEAAAQIGDWEMVKFFEQDADSVEDMAFFGLKGAARGGHEDLVTYFMQNGGETSVNMNQGLVGAAEGGHLKIVKFFLQQGATTPKRALYNAALADQKEVVEYLQVLLPVDQFKSIIGNALSETRKNQNSASQGIIGPLDAPKAGIVGYLARLLNTE